MSDRFELALEELVPREEEPRRWDEVLGRADVSRSRHRLWLGVALAAAFTAIVIGAGGAFRADFVDFFRAEEAPEPIRLEFEKMGALSTVRLGPGRTAHKAREVAKFLVDGKRRPLWVAPMDNGAYCYRWHTFGSCGRMPHQRHEMKLGLGGQEGDYGLNWLVVSVSDPAIQRIELEYADGERVDLPFVWVSPPIDAGFTVFQVPAERQREGLHAVAVIGLDSEGKQVERGRLPGPTDPRWEPGPDGLPRIADRTKKRTLFDFRDEEGTRWTLIVAPAPEEKLCYAFNRGGGCVSPRHGPTPLSVQGGGKTAYVCCTVKESVTTVELLFEDGDRIEVKPIDGFLLYAIPSTHYSRGKRLEAIVSRDASGREVDRVQVKPDNPGLYPCTKDEELDLGYGQTICP